MKVKRIAMMLFLVGLGAAGLHAQQPKLSELACGTDRIASGSVCVEKRTGLLYLVTVPPNPPDKHMMVPVDPCPGCSTQTRVELPKPVAKPTEQKPRGMDTGFSLPHADSTYHPSKVYTPAPTTQPGEMTPQQQQMYQVGQDAFATGVVITQLGIAAVRAFIRAQREHAAKVEAERNLAKTLADKWLNTMESSRTTLNLSAAYADDSEIARHRTNARNLWTTSRTGYCYEAHRGAKYTDLDGQQQVCGKVKDKDYWCEMASNPDTAITGAQFQAYVRKLHCAKPAVAPPHSPSISADAATPPQVQETAEQRQAFLTANRWTELHPEFVRSKANAEAMTRYMQEHNMNPLILAEYDRAFQAIKDSLELKK